jgi:hypothetical protein
VPAVGFVLEALVAIDGSKFKAVNNRDRNFTSAKLQRRMDRVQHQPLPAALDTADRQEPAVAQVKAERLRDKIATLKAKMRELKEIEVQLNETPDKQLSLTDPDARSMKTWHGNGRLQRAGSSRRDAPPDRDPRGHERRRRSRPTELDGQAGASSHGCQELSAVADRGYFKGEEILACQEAGITVFVPKTLTSGGDSGGPLWQR